MTIEAARLAMTEAKITYDEVVDAGAYQEDLQTAWRAYRETALRYHITVVHDANYAMLNPTCREDLEAELRDAIKSKLDYAPAVLKALEESQERSGIFDRYDVYAKASDRSLRYISEKAFDKAMAVLDKHCPMRSDTGALCPPYKLKVGKNDTLVAE